MNPKIEEMARDPVMGRALREWGAALAENSGNPPPPANGNGEYTGQPTSGLRARDITQDRPSDMVPSYQLPGRSAGEPLAWHRQVCETAAGSLGHEGAAAAAVHQANEKPAPAPSQIHPTLAHMNPELGKVLTTVYEHQMQVSNTRPGEPVPTFQQPPSQAGQGTKSAGMEAALADPAFAKIRDAVAQVYKEARENTGATRSEDQTREVQQSRGREGQGR